MTTPLAIRNELGDNADLMVYPDAYLENQRLVLTTQLSCIVQELESVLKAQRLKRQLQQQNRVAVQLTERDEAGNVVDVVLRVMPIPDAINLLNRSTERDDLINRDVQFHVWTSDGYDLATSAGLRLTS